MRGLLVGYGSIGRRHLTNFHTLGIDDWAVVRTGLGTLAGPSIPVRSYTALDVALRTERPDFVVVANPSNAHVTTAVESLHAECHVLLEKPVSDRPEELQLLADAAGRHPNKVLVGFQFRYHPALRRIKEIVDGHTLGAPLHARVVWGEYLPAWHPWEDFRTGYAARRDLGGGVHHTICHPIDYLRMIFGTSPEIVSAALTSGPLGLEVAEAADVLIRFGSGVLVDLHLDYWSQPPVHRVEVVCAHGTIFWDYRTGEFRVWSADTEDWRPETYPSLEERNDLFLAQSRHLLDLVGSPDLVPICGADDGIAAARLCAAIEVVAGPHAASVG